MMRIKLKILTCLAAMVILVLPLEAIKAAPMGDPLQRPALKSPVAEHSVMLDIKGIDGHLIAVGERGLILYSDDAGASWQQADVPVSVTLTAVDFVSASQGWVVGHSGVVLHTKDGGHTWSKQLDGVQAAALALAEAQQQASAQPQDAQVQADLKAAEWLVKDGADKPFLDVHFVDEKKGFIVGAYGLFFATDDGGATWSSRIIASDNPQGMNLYSINSRNGVLYVAGEQGFFAHSINGGLAFERIQTPYQGTWFVIAGTADDNIFLGGLRGNAFLFEPANKEFIQVYISTGVSFSSALALDNDNKLFFVDQSGQILESHDNGHSVHFKMRPPGAPLIVLAKSNQDNSLIGGGFGGLTQLSLKSTHEVTGND